MKVRAQIGKVLNLDKCIGCHTCSVTCKNVWTSREGMEYAWFNNVETKPGIGYPKDWENQKRWNGGWVKKPNGRIEPEWAANGGSLPRFSPTPICPKSTIITNPSTFDYAHLQTAPEMQAFPTARPRSLITGERMEKIEWGPNWEEILGGEFSKRSKDCELRRRPEGNLRPVRKHLHDVSAAAVRTLPQPDLRRGLPVGRDLQARGRRHRPDRSGKVPRLADVRVGLPVQENLLQLAIGQIRKVHLLLSAHRGRPADRLFGNLRRAHPLPRRHAVRCRPHRMGGIGAEKASFTSASSKSSSIRNDPAVIAQARADGVAEAWLEAARSSPV